MSTINLQVVSFFALGAALLAYIGYAFIKQNKQPMRNFGIGLAAASTAFVFWLYIVAFHPSDLKTLTLLSIVPFVASFIIFITAAVSDIKAKYQMPLYILAATILATFAVLRLFVYDSQPGFNEDGFFAFNIAPVVLYFYAMLNAFTFIPAIYVVARHIKHDMLRILVELGLTLFAIGMIVMIIGSDDLLQVINGVGMIVGLVMAAGGIAYYKLDKNYKS